MSKPAHELSKEHEAAINRNPHPDFAAVETARPPWNPTTSWRWTQTKAPQWQVGSGATDGGASARAEHVSIDPYAEGRAARLNYKLLISAIVPRPIGFVSTCSADGASSNLAPYSYTQLVNHDPPVFVIGFAGAVAKDSLRNLVETGECVINVVSEHFVEAMNATAVNAPFGVSEWALSGLTPAACEVVRASRVREAVFSVEGKLMETKEFESRAKPGTKTGTLAIIEGVRFWAREDAINDEHSLIDPEILRPVARMGGITYGRTLEGIEIPRPDWDAFKHDADAKGVIQAKADGQQ